MLDAEMIEYVPKIWTIESLTKIMKQHVSVLYHPKTSKIPPFVTSKQLFADKNENVGALFDTALRATKYMLQR